MRRFDRSGCLGGVGGPLSQVPETVVPEIRLVVVASAEDEVALVEAALVDEALELLDAPSWGGAP